MLLQPVPSQSVPHGCVDSHNQTASHHLHVGRLPPPYRDIHSDGRVLPYDLRTDEEHTNQHTDNLLQSLSLLQTLSGSQS